ncbi:MAG: histidine phosphatase family protein [Verrucomicrobiota bacterium]
MKIFLLRHAKAQPGFPDSDRRLEPEGSKHAAKLGAFLKNNPRFLPEKLWCSPLTRAQETAAVFTQSWGGSIGSPNEVEQLEPEIDPAPLVEMLSFERHDTLIVGHNPNLETLASLLISGERARSRVRLKTCCLICLQWNPLPNFGHFGPCELLWMLDPRVI